ncbi:MAG: aquaporin [Acidimicrobiales bacterium]
MNSRSLFAELVGTAFLVFFGVGAATLSFGFKITGASPSAGVVVTALTFGLVLLGLAYAIGPVSGCHINPAVTMGFLACQRISLTQAVGYWAAQFVGGIAGAAALYGVVSATPAYSTKTVGLGTDGYGKHSMVGLSGGGAFAVEVILTLLFVFVILSVTRQGASPAVAGIAIGLSLTLVHLVGIPLDGTSVNPARALAPALFVGGQALNQVWVFILAPLIGGALGAATYLGIHGRTETAPAPVVATSPGAEPALGS